MAGCNVCVVPMEVFIKLSKATNSPKVDAIEYQSIICRLPCLVNTRRNLIYAMGL